MTFPLKIVFQGGRRITTQVERKAMKKIPKQEYATEFKELLVKRVKAGQTIGAVAKDLGL